MLPESLIVKRARKIVDAGSVTLAHLQESIATGGGGETSYVF